MLLLYPVLHPHRSESSVTVNIFSRRSDTTRKPSAKRGQRDLAKALAKAPTRASRDELLLLQNR